MINTTHKPSSFANSVSHLLSSWSTLACFCCRKLTNERRDVDICKTNPCDHFIPHNSHVRMENTLLLAVTDEANDIRDGFSLSAFQISSFSELFSRGATFGVGLASSSMAALMATSSFVPSSTTKLRPPLDTVLKNFFTPQQGREKRRSKPI